MTEWASNHHEKLSGRGYPYGFDRSELDFEAQLIACMDVYQALTEERPYRKPLSHTEATYILHTMVQNGDVNGDIVHDIMVQCGGQRSRD